MRIDRQRFLLLTASLSGACASSTRATDQPREHTAIAPPEPVEPEENPPAKSAEPEADAGTTAVAVAVVAEPSNAQGAQFSLNSDPKCKK